MNTSPSPVTFRIEEVCGQARAGVLRTPHGVVPTPTFLPTASQGSIKALSPEDAKATGTAMILANTYHLSLRPGIELIERLGGLHRFMGWDGPILTDSGGFQAFSLGDLRKVTEDGLLFKSHLDGSLRFLIPEDAIRYQQALGSDIMTCLDECLAYPADEESARRAMERTHRWALRCKEALKSPGQALFGIVQGGHSPELRSRSVELLTGLDFDGYAVGGLSVGEPKALLYEVAGHTAGLLPREKARYLMGVGAPEDLVEAVALGYDLFDCALPTRVARTGGIYTSGGRIDITTARFREEPGPLEDGCDCPTCKQFSAAYLHHLFKAQELLAYRLATLHNLRFFQRLMAQMRKAILEQTFEQFRQRFRQHYRPADEATRLEQKERWLSSRRKGREETWH